MSKELTLAYQQCLQEYKSQWEIVKRLSSRSVVDQEKLHGADLIRDEIHKKLRTLAREIGKSASDVDIDLLTNQESLVEYQLPEFRLMKPWEVLEKPDAYFVSGRVDTRLEYLDVTKLQIPELKEQTELFIPFCEELAHRFLQGEVFFQRPLDSFERGRKVEKAVDMLGGKARYVQFETQTTFHQWIRFFGVAFPKEQLDFVLNQLSSRYSEISIDRRTFSQEQLQEDSMKIIDEDINRLLAHEPEVYGSYKETIRVYMNGHLRMLSKNDPLYTFIEEKSVDVVERGKSEDFRKEVLREQSKIEKRMENVPSRFDNIADVLEGRGSGRK